jgi:hypothetical protein
MKARYVSFAALVAAAACGCNAILGISLLDGGGPGDGGTEGGGVGDAESDVSDVGVSEAAADVSDAGVSEAAPDVFVLEGSPDAPDAPPPDADAGCYPTPSGLASWWKAEGTADDSAGSNNGTPTNVTFVSGAVGRAFHFASGGYITASAAGLPTGNSDRTIEMWTRVDIDYLADAAYSEGLFFGYGGFGTAGATYSLLVVAGGMNSIPTNTLAFSQWGLERASHTLDKTWHHVAATLKGGSISTYLDGTLVDYAATFTINTSAGGPILIGGGVPGNDPCWLTGDVDEVAVYTRALTGDEIQGIFDAGSAGKCP